MISQKPRISVIIPAFNAMKTITQTVNSVLVQTLQDFELIIVNDGSQDKTLNILQSFTDSRIKILTYPNAGSSVSRNRGFRHARGEFIAFLDADDLWTADKLEAQWAALKQNSDCHVAYSWTNFIDSCGRALYTGSHATASGYVLPEILLNNFLESGSNPLIHRDALETIGGFDESLSAFQDTDLYIRLAAKFQFIAVPKVQIYYRRSENSVSSNLRNIEESGLRSLEAIFAQLPPTLQPLKPYSVANLYKHLMFKAMQGIPTKQSSGFLLHLALRVVQTDPKILSKRVSIKLLIKLLFIIALPQKGYEYVLNRMQWLLELRSLLGYLKTDASLCKL